MRRGAFQAAFDRSIRDPEGFWGEAAEAVHWYKKWDKVLDDSNKPFYRWFTGGMVNTCYNALDLHVENGRADQFALIYDSPVTGKIQTFTYRELRDEVATFAGALAGLGVGKGDRVIIYMPMIPQAAVAMLACARLGAVHSVVFGGFAANELAVRIDDAKPKVVVSASCGIEVSRIISYKPLLDEAIRLAKHKPEKCIILQRPMQPAEMIAGRDLDWEEEMWNGKAARLCAGRGDCSSLYFVYVRDDRAAERCGARQWRPHRGLEMDHEEHLWRRSRRRVLGGFRHRLGGWPFLHRLRAVVPRKHGDPLRGQASRDTGRRSILARHLAAQCKSAVRGSHRLARYQKGRSQRHAHKEL